jgi:hypothetical protein
VTAKPANSTSTSILTACHGCLLHASDVGGGRIAVPRSPAGGRA